MPNSDAWARMPQRANDMPEPLSDSQIVALYRHALAQAIFERDSLRVLISQTAVYLDARVGNKPDTRG